MRLFPTSSSVRLVAALAVPALLTGCELPQPETGVGQAAVDMDDHRSVAVVGVVDGDTFDVALGGVTTRIRVIGVNAPESKHPTKPVECFGPEAAERAAALLTGQGVTLETDPTQDRFDRYGRMLAHVRLPDGQLFAEVMIRDGYAFEYAYATPARYTDRFVAAQQTARDHQVGLWGACPGR